MTKNFKQDIIDDKLIIQYEPKDFQFNHDPISKRFFEDYQEIFEITSLSENTTISSSKYNLIVQNYPHSPEKYI